MRDKYSRYFTILSVVCTEHEAEILAFAPPRLCVILMYSKTWGRDHHARQGQGCVQYFIYQAYLEVEPPSAPKSNEIPVSRYLLSHKGMSKPRCQSKVI